MIRVWVARDTKTLDPAYAARDASSQVLALRLATGAGMEYGLRMDEGYAEVFFNGNEAQAKQLLLDFGANALQVYLIEATTTQERDFLRRLLSALPRLRYGALAHTSSEDARQCPVELVTEFGDHRATHSRQDEL